MHIAVVSVSAILLYLLAAVRTASVLRAVTGEAPGPRLQGLTLGFLAVALHAFALWQEIVAPEGLNLSLFNSLSLVAWTVAALVLVATVSKPLEALAVLMLPAAAVAVGLDLVMPGHRILPTGTPFGLELHVLFAILAYSVLSVAAIEALAVAFAERRLRDRRPTMVIHLLPPLRTMEDLLFQLIGTGVLLLTVALVAGFMFVQDLFAQHLIHKTVLSVLAWCIFVVLLWGRRQFGWRGIRAVRYTLAGFVVLMLAFFGSKFVLEVVLQRV